MKKYIGPVIACAAFAAAAFSLFSVIRGRAAGRSENSV